MRFTTLSRARPVTASDQIGREREPHYCLRWLILLFGLCVPQFLMYGSAFVGWTVLLPLDLLQATSIGLVAPPAGRSTEDLFDPVLLDLVTIAEPERRSLNRALWSGEFPLTNPGSYCGGPSPLSGKFSLYGLAAALIANPCWLVWVHLGVTLLAGTGAYVFFRRVLEAGFWTACCGAWAYPLTGFFVLWQGYALDYAVAWLPWILVCIWLVARNGSPLAWVGMVLAILQVMTARIDCGGHVLLASGFWGLFCVAEAVGWRWQMKVLERLTTLGLGWVLALGLASPYVLPVLEYTHNGSRIARRAAGEEERPPGGLVRLPQLLCADFFGGSQRGWLYLHPGNLPEGAASGSMGLIACLGLAPLAFSNRRWRWTGVFWLAMIVLGWAWQLNLPGLVPLLRLPILNIFSHNRFVFLATFGWCVLAVLGLEQLRRGTALKSAGALVAGGCLGLAALGFAVSALNLPMPEVRSEMAALLSKGEPVLQMTRPEQLKEAEDRIKEARLLAAAWALGGFLILAMGYRNPKAGLWTAGLLGSLWLAELTHAAQNRRSLSPPELYYPRLEALARINESPPGRVLGIFCVPPRVLELYGLRDLRGYDAVDPQRLVRALERVVDPGAPKSPSYAVLQYFLPRLQVQETGEFDLPGLLDLLEVRYVVTRRALDQPLKPAWELDGLYVYVNDQALPRASIPERVIAMPEREQLALIGDARFHPRELAMVTNTVDLPERIRGSARIVADGANRMTVQTDMDTPGLLVRSDLWDAGWKATVNGTPTPVEIVNTVVQGVRVPIGRSTVVFDYRPASLERGWWVFGASLIALVAAFWGLRWRLRER